jgi:1-deoxy-D-xylulose-5-phosphate reductoisomerase
MRRVAILGSTGSIGRQTLEVIAAHPERFSVAALAGGRNVELLAQQANLWRPTVLSVGSSGGEQTMRARLAYTPASVGHGEQGLVACALEAGADIVVAATDGMIALRAVFESIGRGLHVALANKELLVAAGHLMCGLARTTGARILPVDSEHSAVFQCLAGERTEDVRSVILTASGGPFWTWTAEQMEQATPEDALAHPTWRMGAKNTLDSATLMNKGLEVIEASSLFSLPPATLEIVVHRQSIVHGFVLFRDGSVKAQLASPDMRLPIGFALAYPQRLPAAVAEAKTKAAIGLGDRVTTLSFEPVDQARFPAVRLAYHALALGGTYPAVLSAANETAGRAFLEKQIKFTQIAQIVERALAAHRPSGEDLEDVVEADRFGRAQVHDAVAASR